MPNVTIDTWDLYNEQFYIVTTLSVLLVGSSLLWGFYLLRSVRRRKVIQGDLENQISFRKRSRFLTESNLCCKLAR